MNAIFQHARYVNGSGTIIEGGGARRRDRRPSRTIQKRSQASYPKAYDEVSPHSEMQTRFLQRCDA